MDSLRKAASAHAGSLSRLMEERLEFVQHKGVSSELAEAGAIGHHLVREAIVLTTGHPNRVQGATLAILAAVIALRHEIGEALGEDALVRFQVLAEEMVSTMRRNVPNAVDRVANIAHH